MRNWMIGLMLAISTPALADHGAQPTGPNAAAIQHSFRVTSTLAAYDVDGERGEWSALVAQGEYAATDWMSVVASVPTVRITSDWGDSSSGIGDMSLGLKSTIPSWEIQDFRWVVALYGTAPTGSEEKRIGAGHFELAPVLEMAFALRQQWTISTTAGTKVSLGRPSRPRT